MPKISILLPNYNSGSYVSECIASIQAQTITEYEVIIGDSGSNDGSAELLREYAQGDERVKFYSIAREGIYPGWNECLSRATGDFIHVCTADDWIAPDLLQHLLSRLLEDEELMATYAPLAWADFEGNLDHDKWPRLNSVACLPDCRKRLYGTDSLKKMFLLGHPIISINQLLIRRHAFDWVGQFPANIGRAGDLLWQLRLVACSPIEHVSKSYAVWRVHPGQATGNDKLANKLLNIQCQEHLIDDAIVDNSQLLPIIKWNRLSLALRCNSIGTLKRLCWILGGVLYFPMLVRRAMLPATDRLRYIQEYFRL